MRTEFTDDAAWTSLLDTMRCPGPGYDDPVEDFSDDTDSVDDPTFEGSSPEQLMALVRDSQDPEQLTADLVVVADGTAMRDPGHRVLVVLLRGPIGYTLRMEPQRVGGMVGNPAIGNMDIGKMIRVGGNAAALPCD